MKARTLLYCIGVVVLGVAFAGCSFSASASVGTDGKTTIVGKDKIVVTAAQPAAPDKPKPPKKIMKARVVGKKIEITEKVMFDTGKATIKVDSHQLLKDVAEVMAEHKKIAKIGIEGHTDSVGKNKSNKKLSENRAKAVMDFLVSVGVDESRLQSEGFGEEKPIADNDTDEGKEKNRRVEFNILEQGK